MVIATGPVRGAEVFADSDGDFIPDGGAAPIITLSGGDFTFPDDTVPYKASAGVDTFLGTALSGITLSAPAGASVITPLTTLLDRAGVTQDQLKTVFSIPQDVDLLDFNPLIDSLSADSQAVEAAAQTTLVYLVAFQRLLDASADNAGAPIDLDEALEQAIDLFGSVIASGETRLGNLSVINGFLDDANLTFPDYLATFAQGYTASIIEDLYAAINFGNVPQSAGAIVYAFSQFLSELDAVFATTREEDLQDLIDQPGFAFLGPNPDFSRFAAILPPQNAENFPAPDIAEIPAGSELFLPVSALLANDVLTGSVTPDDVTDITLFFSNVDTIDVTFDAQNAGVTIAPGPGQTGVATLFYTLEPEGAVATTGLILVNIAPAGSITLARADSFVVPNNQTTAIDVLANDQGSVTSVLRVDGNTLGSFFLDLPSGARIGSAFGGELIYDPNGAFDALGPGDTRQDTFTYTLGSIDGGRSTATVSVTVEGIRAAAPVTGNTVSLVEDSSPLITTGTILLSDTILSDPITIDTVEGSQFDVGDPIAGDFGSLELEADGTFTYRVDPVSLDTVGLAAGQQVTDVFAFTGEDPLGNIITDSVRITIDGVTDAPQFIFGRASAGLIAPTTQTLTEIVISAEGIAYMAAEGGQVLRLDVETGDFLAPIPVGTTLAGLTLNAAGTQLYVAERTPLSFMESNDPSTPSNGVAAVYEISLADLSVTTFELPIMGDARGALDVVALSDGTVLVSFDTPVSPNSLAQTVLDPSDGSLSTIEGLRLGPLLETDAVGGTLLIQNQGSTSGTFILYDVTEKTILAETDSFEILDETGATGNSSSTNITSISAEAGLIAVGSSDGLTVFDFELEPIATLNDQFIDQPNGPGTALENGVSGVAFSPSGKQLFVLDSNTDIVRVYDTQAFSLSYWLEVGEDISARGLETDAPNLEFSPDGQALLVQTPTGVGIFNFAVTDDDLLVPILRVEEGTTTVAPISGFAVDIEGDAFFGIVDEGDGSAFRLDGTSFSLVFNTVPDASAPMDTNADNLYSLSLSLQDAGGTVQIQPLFVDVVASDDLMTPMV